MLRTTRITVLLLSAAWIADYIDRIVINFALPAIGDDLNLDHTQLGMVVSVFFLAYAGMQIPAGLLADRYGALTMGTIGLLAWSVFTGLTAVAWSFSTLLAMRFLFGLVQGVFPPAALKALSERSLPEQRTTASGWTNASNAVGTLLAALVAAILLPTVGWRIMFALISLLGVAVLLAWRRWMPDPLPEAVAAPDARPVRDRRLRRLVMRSPALLGFAVIFFGYDAIVWGLSAWMPTYLHDEYGVSTSTAALIGLPATVFAAMGTVAGARLSDRIGGRPRRIVVPAMIVTAALAVALPYAGSVLVFVIAATVLGTVASLCYMPAFAVPLRALPTELLGSATAVIIFGGQLAGVVTPLLFGAVTDHVSYTAAFATLTLGPVLAIAAAAVVPQTADAFRALLPQPPAPEPKETLA
ncbi:MFS transporter [Nocardia otitidiscaviarum]|uniref:MFS transporter n=1 Tax=Nocardia otitidiscaviarum TaxID=1823 RepID=UPI000694BA89|nr:MFS transporter [Nocardia otitidiscaviarum]MBF6132103.1 MFS transporter [Nocardia otitidiscaviarum]